MSAASRLTDAVARACSPGPREYTVHDSALRGFSLRVRPSGAKTWVLRLRRKGEARRLVLGDALVVSADTARQRAHAFLSGHLPETEGRVPTALTFEQFVPIYLERRAADWRESTRRANTVYLRAQLLPALGPQPLDRIGVPEVATWFHGYSRSRPGGANRALAVLSDLFLRAIAWGHLPARHQNPCTAMRRNRTRPRGAALNADALARLGAVLDRYSKARTDSVDAIRLLLLTGARPGEIFRLRWDEFTGDRLILRQAKRGPRAVELGPAALAILRARHKRRGQSPYVFPHPSRPAQPRSLPTDWTWRVFKREAELPPDLRLHDLRHNFASHAILSGESTLVTGALLGHRRPGMTARYTHLADDNLRSASQRIASRVMLFATGTRSHSMALACKPACNSDQASGVTGVQN